MLTGSTLILSLSVAAYLTSVLSGMVGMAGGMVLMAVLVRLVPLPVAMLLHGTTQLVANGSRALLLRNHVRAGVLLPWVAGCLLALALLSGAGWRPGRATVEIALGLVCLAATLPAGEGRVDPRRPAHALVAGAGVTACQLVAGVAGPLLDAAFVGSRMGRHEVVATKAATQVFGHATKLAFWAGALRAGAGADVEVAVGLVPLALVMALAAMAGTAKGRRLLDRLDEAGFRSLTRGLLRLLGTFSLVSGILALATAGVPSAP